MRFADDGFAPYALTLARRSPLPLVCDSPHSGSVYPSDFRTVLPLTDLRWAEDAFVDELWQAIPDVGGALLAANFPRSYVDVNRELDDIDPAMLAEPWAGPLAPSDKSRHGCGLVWTQLNGRPLYDHKLFAAEVLDRIERCYKPYVQALHERMTAHERQFGVAWHLNVHSMPSTTVKVLGLHGTLPDVVLGDLDGRSCDPTFIGIVEDFLKERGYSVARNHPFKGMALLRHFGRPAKNWHSLQIEINRALYMDEAAYEKSPGFARVQNDMAGLSRHVADFVASLL